MRTDRSTLLAILAEASRAPSAHNVQPARWRFESDGTVLLFEDVRRRLLVADPTAHDTAIGLGAAFEGLHLALSRVGVDLRPPDLSTGVRLLDAVPPGLRLVARSSFISAGLPDPLAPIVPERRTFRGRFLRPNQDAIKHLEVLLKSSHHVIPLFARADIAAVAMLHDQCSDHFFRSPDYREELVGWLRFSPRDPRWVRDGLTTDCMGLPRAVAPLAAALFRPAVFDSLQKLGLAYLLTAERSQTLSATAIVVLTADKDEDPFEAGRRFYRVWLDLCRGGFGACPMSALSDSPVGAKFLHDCCDLPASQRIVNVLRVGEVPSRAAACSPRIPPGELLV